MDDCINCDLNPVTGGGLCPDHRHLADEPIVVEMPPALARHYSDDVCPLDCPFCADLARVDAILRRADDEECEWPPVVLGGEGGEGVGS